MVFHTPTSGICLIIERCNHLWSGSDDPGGEPFVCILVADKPSMDGG
jgi:hypothetical protein